MVPPVCQSGCRHLKLVINNLYRSDERGYVHMNNNIERVHRIAFARNLFASALMLAGVLGSTAYAVGQKVTPPPTPASITPPPDQSAFLEGHALGTQGYVCLPTTTGGTSW